MYGQCIQGSIFHNDHTEAAFRYSELSVSFGTCQHSQRPNAILFTCKHCSHSSTLRDEVQKEAALAQVLQVLQTVAAAALVQVVTCERMFSQSPVVIRAHTGYFWLCQKMGWDEMRGPIRFRGASVWASTPTLLLRMFTTRYQNLRDTFVYIKAPTSLWSRSCKSHWKLLNLSMSTDPFRLASYSTLISSPSSKP